ncbi:MAG TPA: MFS transporter [Geminicoccaceae bacterium]|nr:MFS transporter [Geminicoccaceae bacterium]
MPEPRLSRTVLLAYGGLGLPLAALNLPLYVYLPAFYADELGLGLAAVGGALFAARLLDALTDPVIGELSDRSRSRVGRRRPWLVVACPLLLWATWMLFVPEGAVASGYLFLWSSVAYVAWTLMLLPYTAWGAELAGGYHERSRITAVREGCVILGIVLAAALPALLGVGAGDQGPVLAALAWLMLLLLPLALLALVLVVPEGDPGERTPLDPKRGLALAWRNRPFRRLIGAYLLNGIANGLPATLFLIFTADRLQLPERAGPLLLLYFVAGIAAIPLWLQLSYRIAKHRAWAVAMLWASAAFVWVPLLGPGDFWGFVLICLLSGVSLGADLALPASLQADVVDLDWLESGRRRTGLFFAVWSMTTKLSLALAVGIAFPILELAGFRAGGANSAVALGTLAALYGLVPVAIKLAATALVWNFPITEALQGETRRKLEGRAAAAAGGAP